MKLSLSGERLWRATSRLDLLQENEPDPFVPQTLCSSQGIQKTCRSADDHPAPKTGCPACRWRDSSTKNGVRFT
jgi:hypothetical protein